MARKGLDLHVHHIVRHPEMGDVLERTNAYCRLSEDKEHVFIQNGQVYWAEGDPVPRKEWPVWLPARLQELTPEVLEETGFTAVVQNLNARTTSVRTAPRVPT